MNLFDEQIGYEISFREVELEKDLERLHQWHHQAHVIPFWNQNFELPDYKVHLQKLLADHHHTLYIGQLDDEPMCYFERYCAMDDVIANYYDAESGDQGIHLLIGPDVFLGKGLSLPLVRAMTAFGFQNPETKKVIAEPDIRNEKMIHVFKKCGFEAIKEVDLPDKRGLLMFCEREEFLRRWEGVYYIQPSDA